MARSEHIRVTKRALLSARVALLLVLGETGIASATVGGLGSYVFDGVNIRTDPYLTATVVGQGFTGQNLCTDYTETGDSVNGNPYWAHHGNLSTGKIGFSSWNYLGVYDPPQQCSF